MNDCPASAELCRGGVLLIQKWKLRWYDMGIAEDKIYFWD
jgi:hypothetical protein